MSQRNITLAAAPPKRRAKGPPAGLRIVLDSEPTHDAPSLIVQDVEPDMLNTRMHIENVNESTLETYSPSPISALSGPSPFSSPNPTASEESSPAKPTNDHSTPPLSAIADASDGPPPKRAGRNRKNLSLSLQPKASNASLQSISSVTPAPVPAIAHPSTTISLPATPQQPTHKPLVFNVERRRASVASLPAVPNRVHRSVEDAEPGAPYENGPIEILPGLWLGAEENARDCQGLTDRGIGAILNVAKEVPPPFTLSTASSSSSDTKSTYHPADRATGQPNLAYMHLRWSHGQPDLVQNGFPTAMEFVDRSLENGNGVLVHCQCGVSRSATMIIALVMRAAHLPDASEQLAELMKGGMHAAYAFVKEKSPWVGPNMSLIYQLLEYERHLSPQNHNSDASSILSEEEEWSRRRREMEEESDADTSNEPDYAAIEAQEARDLDRQMIERFEGVKRKASLASTTSTASTSNSVAGPTGMGQWMNRFGGARGRAASIESNFSRVSAFSEESVPEVDEENEDNDPPTGRLRQSSISTTSTHSVTDDDDDDVQLTSKHNTFIIPTSITPKSTVIPLQLPPPRNRLPRASPKPLSRTATLPVPPSAPPTKSAFGDVGVPFPRRTQSPLTPSQQPAVKRPIAKPPPLKLQTVPSSPPSAHKRTDRQPRPAALHLNAANLKPNIVVTQRSPTRPKPTYSFRPRQISSAAPHQTLFIFPASPTRAETFIPSTPSTLTLTSSTSGFPLSPSIATLALPTPTPTLSSFRRDSMNKRQSWLGGVPVTPTQGVSRVDAKGWLAPGSGMGDFRPLTPRRRI